MKEEDKNKFQGETINEVKEIQEEIPNKKNIKSYFYKNKKIIYVIGLTLIVLIAIGGINLKSGCIGSICGLTGNVIAQDNSKIVAEFNGGKITSDELDNAYNLFFFFRGLPETYKSLMPKANFLNQTISEELLYLQAKKDYEISNTQVENSLKDSLTKTGASLSDLKKQLENSTIEYKNVLDFYKKQLVITNFLNGTLFKNIEISEKDAQNYYNQNKEQFKIPEEIRASHILVDSSEKASEIIKKLDTGEDFAKLARENSIGPSNISGGDLGFFSKGKMVPEFEDAAFNLKNIGDYTETPVKTQFGYHIIKLTDRKEAKNLSFEESKKNIKDQLLSEKQNKLLKEYLSGLEEKADIKIYQENINEEN